MLSDKIAIDAINVRCRFVAPFDALIVFLLRSEKFKKKKNVSLNSSYIVFEHVCVDRVKWLTLFGAVVSLDVCENNATGIAFAAERRHTRKPRQARNKMAFFPLASARHCSYTIFTCFPVIKSGSELKFNRAGILFWISMCSTLVRSCFMETQRIGF